MVERSSLKETSAGLHWRDFGMGFYQLLPIQNTEMSSHNLYLLHKPALSYFLGTYSFILLNGFGFQDKGSLYSRGYPETDYVDQSSLELRDLPASATWVLGLKACTGMTVSS